MLNLIFASFLIFFIVFINNAILNNNHMTFELWLMSIIYLVPYSYQLLRLRRSIVDYETSDGTDKFSKIDTAESLKIINQPALMIIMIITCLAISFII
tara:strand:- start:66 stop:359 length:294 start_codon:yes stop_codon:yes gene_type:complete